ncbi:MAG: acyltransferase family protein [Massilia sp.]|nr:acyltransferase family protein [Massilia sp.]
MPAGKLQQVPQGADRSVPVVADDTVVSGRVEGFDILRGMCALAVAYYHVLSWTGAAHLESWGRYGVYIFFVLSGASMYAAYGEKFAQGYSPAKFIVQRIIRLAPLYLVALGLKTAYAIVTGRSLFEELGMMLLNASFTFGLGNPAETARVIGGWSLGIEFLFYLTFPIVVATMRSSWGIAVLAGSFVVQHIFVNSVLAGTTLEQAWVPYTQMLSFVFYFIAGSWIGKLITAGKLSYSPWSLAGMCLSLLPLATLNGGDNLTGLTGLGLSICAAVTVLLSASIPKSRLVSTASEYLGRVSYGVYLIHPFLYMAAKNLPFLQQWPLAGATVVVGLSAVLALLAEKHIEAPARRHAKRWLGK